MKVVFLAPFGIRPKGTLFARMLPLASTLQGLGHEVVIIAPPYTNPEDAGRTEVVRGVPVRNILLGPRNRALAAPLLAWRMFRAALDEAPDLIHLFKPKGYGGLAVMLMWICARSGIRIPPLFLDSDDLEGDGGMNQRLDYSLVERRLYAWQEKSLPPRMVGVTVASRALEELYLEKGTARDRLLYLPNCVEERPPGDGAGTRKKLGIAPDAPLLLLYTRFFEFEQERLYYVLSGICRRVPDVRILVVGKGPQGEEKRLVAASFEGGFGDALNMAGWVAPGDLPDYLAAGDAAIYPFADNRINRAKCPAKLTELIVSGVPVVADRVGQIPEYTAPQLRELLCAADDGDEMIEKSVRLLTDEQWRRKASQIGREFIIANFAWVEHARRLNDLYRRLV
ncbi:MAG TPA: glycosyltransferase family 4 protein [Geobacteraceae bacterium]